MASAEQDDAITLGRQFERIFSNVPPAVSPNEALLITNCEWINGYFFEWNDDVI